VNFMAVNFILFTNSSAYTDVRESGRFVKFC